MVPPIFSRSITRLSAMAAVMLSGIPELWPSPCPGAPSTSGACSRTPGFCEVSSSPSTSDPSAMTGFPLPHDASQPVGMPATSSSTAKPCSRRIAVQ